METSPRSHRPTFDVGPQAPTPILCRQESPEHIINFTALNSPLSWPSEAVEASFIYHQTLADCERDGPPSIPPRDPRPVPTDLTNPANSPNQTGQHAGGTGGLPSTTEGGSGLDILEDASTPSPNNDNDNDNDNDNEYDDEASTSPLVHEVFAALYEHASTVQGRANIVRLVLHALLSPSSPDNYTSAPQRSLGAILPLARAWPTHTLPSRKVASTELPHSLRRSSSTASSCLSSPRVATHPRYAHSSSPTSRSEINPTAQATYSRLQSLRRLYRSRNGNRCVMPHQQGHASARCRMLPSHR